jgi:hypothetical protein
MVEFNTPISDGQRTFLADNKADLCKTEGGKSIWQNRVKKASEAYNELKGIHGAHELHTLVPKTSEDEGDDADLTFPDWPTFRDNFILDWIGSRTVVTEQEADMIFERTAEEALAVIEQGEQITADAESDGPPYTTQTPQEMAQENLQKHLAEQKGVTETPPVATKRRGRPPGASKKSTVTKLTRSKPSTRKVAAKKSGAKSSASAKAQGIIEKYASRDWSRKDIIGKLQAQLGMGAAYASTLYQKFA